MRVLRYVRGTKEPEEIDITALAAAIDPENAVVWIDTDDPNDAERDDVMRRLDVSPLVVEALTNPKPERTKLIRYGEYFHVAVHDCEMQGDELESREVDVVIGPGWLVTVRHASELPTSRPVDIDEVARRFDIMRLEHDATEEGFLLWALFDVVIDRYFDVNDVIDDRLDDIEEEVFSEDKPRSNEIPQSVIRLRKGLAAFRRAAAPMRDVLDAISRRDLPFICEESITHYRELYDRLLRVLDFIETERDLLTSLLEANLAEISNDLNDVMKKVTSWGAILVSATLIAGIYGMNFREMPELKWSLGYPFALGSMVLVMAILYAVFKRRKWL